jgi:tetratricopeptide (TPR) repeat protein
MLDMNDTYGDDNPLVVVVKKLICENQEKLAELVIDAFSGFAKQKEEINCIAKLYYDIRNYNKAEQYTLKTLDMCETNEEKYNARSNLGKLYNNFNEPVKSLFYSKQNLSVTPNNPDTLLEISFSYFLNGEKDKAEKIIRKLKEREHQLQERHRDVVNFNLGTYDMEAGDFLKGLSGFIFNVRKLDLWYHDDNIPIKYWDGGIYPGKTIILYMSGGGFGDAFIAISYWIKLKNTGFNPIFCVDNQDISDIFNRCGYTTVTNWRDVKGQDAMWCFAFEVPIYLNSKPHEMLTERYLWASDVAREKWSWLKNRKKLKVGVRFIGNKRNNQLLYRHIELDNMMKFLHETFDGYDVEYYSLQKGDGEEEAEKCQELIKVADQINSFDDTLALIENLDIVISTCTSVVHLAGAVGTKVIVFVPIAAYFTYLTKPKDRPEHTSLWYGDNFRFFRQVKPKVWDEPMDEAKKFIKTGFIENHNQRHKSISDNVPQGDLA